MKKLGACSAIFRGKSSDRDRIHAIDTEKPSTRASVFGQGLKVDAAGIPGYLFGEGIHPYAIIGRQVSSVLINKGIYQAIARAVAPGKTRELP